jgi:hypothetical protein
MGAFSIHESSHLTHEDWKKMREYNKKQGFIGFTNQKREDLD